MGAPQLFVCGSPEGSVTFKLGGITMHTKIKTLVAMLKANGDYGTANAIVDAFDIVKRAKSMLKEAEATYDKTDYFAEEQMMQFRIDVLREVLDTKP